MQEQQPQLRGRLTSILVQKTQELWDKFPYAQTVKLPGEQSLSRYYALHKDEDGCIWLRRTWGYSWSWAGDNMESLLETLEKWDDIVKAFKESHEEVVARGEKILERFA